MTWGTRSDATTTPCQILTRRDTTRVSIIATFPEDEDLDEYSMHYDDWGEDSDSDPYGTDDEFDDDDVMDTDDEDMQDA